MKKFLFVLSLILGIQPLVHAGMISYTFAPLGAITISSNTVIPIVLDTATTSANAAAANPCTWSMTFGNGSTAPHQAVVVACATGNHTVNSVSIGGVGLNLQQITTGITQVVGAEIFYATHTLSGAQTITVTPSGGTCGANTGGVQCVASNWTGVSPTTPIDVSTGAVNTASAGSITATNTLTYSTDMLVDAVNANGNGSTLTVGSGQTVLGNFANSTQGFNWASSYLGPLSVSGSKSLTWNVGGGGNTAALAWVALKQYP